MNEVEAQRANIFWGLTGRLEDLRAHDAQLMNLNYELWWNQLVRNTAARHR